MHVLFQVLPNGPHSINYDGLGKCTPPLGVRPHFKHEFVGPRTLGVMFNFLDQLGVQIPLPNMQRCGINDGDLYGPMVAG